MDMPSWNAWQRPSRRDGRAGARSISIVAVAALLLTTIITVAAVAQQAPATGRLAGSDRIETAVAVSQHAFPAGAAEVYLSRQDLNPDALVGGTLTGGPILLVPQCGPLPAVVRNEIARLSPTRILALGGSSAVCEETLVEAGTVTGDRPPTPPSPPPSEQPTPIPSPSVPEPPPSPQPEQIELQAEGERNTDPFPLAGGDYVVSWTFEGDCYYGVFLQPTGDEGSGESITSGEGPSSGSNNFYDIAAAEYYLQVITGAAPNCPWTVTIETRP